MSEYRYGHCEEKDKDVQGDFLTKEEAIEDGKGYYTGEFWIGKYRLHEPQIEVDSVLDELQCNVEVEQGEDWLNDVSKKDKEVLQELLDEALDKWLVKAGFKPNFGEVVEYEIVR